MFLRIFWDMAELPGKLFDSVRSCFWDLLGRTQSSVYSVTNYFSLLLKNIFLSILLNVLREDFHSGWGIVPFLFLCVLWVMFPLVLLDSSFLDLGNFLIYMRKSSEFRTLLSTVWGFLQIFGIPVLCSSFLASSLPCELKPFWSSSLSDPLPQFREANELRLDFPSCVTAWKVSENSKKV